MKVFLISNEPAPSFKYTEDDAEPGTSPSPAGGWRGWVDRTVDHVKSSLHHPQGRLGRMLKRIWDWLQSRMHPDERLLAALRTAPAIAVYHPLSTPSGEVGGLWCGYLQRRRRRHLAWLALDGLLAPLAVLLTPLPGPNLIGYWFAYRAVSHLLILLGIRRALRGRVETTFHPIADLETGGSDPAGPGRPAKLAV